MVHRFFSLVVCLGAGVAHADDGLVNYSQQVKPIFQARCYSCHGALKQEAGLRLDTGMLIRKGAESGPVVTPADVNESILLDRVTETDEFARMPPEGKPLQAKEIQIIRRWIEQGAQSPDVETAEVDPRSHWSFQYIQRPSLPSAGKDSKWARNPMDLFIAAQQQKRGLTPSRPAAKHVLLRRVYLDLIGLPPTREEVERFLNDDSQGAYERVVDQLLSRPQYGERYGRHWMDVWRYSDWYGRRGVPDALNSYGQIWRWRDWIVRSLNEDQGYDWMVKQMLAADEFASDNFSDGDQNLVATGFIVRNYYRWNYSTWMKDLVEHTGKAFLGITLNCCHCHDHKYDPFTNEEYFRFRAFFEPIDIRQDRVPGEPDPGLYPDYKLGVSFPPMASGMVRIMDRKLDAKTFIYTKGESRDVIPGLPPVSPGGPAILGGDDLDIAQVELPAKAWYPGLKEFVREDELKKAASEVAKAQSALDQLKNNAVAESSKPVQPSAELRRKAAELRLTAAQAADKSLKLRIEADRVRFQATNGNVEQASNTASQAERQANVDQARFEKAEAQWKLSEVERKAAADKKQAKNVKPAQDKLKTASANLAKAEKALKVESTQYTSLSPQYSPLSTGRRRALANWIANRKNPLAARVAVNHLWRWHFGEALVATTENLGRNGARPTHPDLLDWLAVELMESGWRMKHIHRLIVTSQAYRMSSNPLDADRSNQKTDAENDYLWRFRSRRMESEVVRDSILHVAGQLNLSIGGKEITAKLGLTTPRRSMYFEHHGEGRMPWLELFDAPSPTDCYRRSTSVRPQQALAISNSELGVRQGRLLARSLNSRIQKGPATERSNSDDAQVTFIVAAFEQVLARNPTPQEIQLSRKFLRKQSALFTKADLKTTSPNNAADTPPSTDPVMRARENLVQALFNHNDFVTIR